MREIPELEMPGKAEKKTIKVYLPWGAHGVWRGNAGRALSGGEKKRINSMQKESQRGKWG